jgi:3-hydroxybutyryl-CoA dehydrogenase
MSLRTVNNIAVLGAGTMGAGLAHVFAAGNYNVKLYDIAEASLERALSVIRGSLETCVESGTLTAAQRDVALGKVETTLSLDEAIAGADLVVETIIEKIAAKKEIYEKLDALCPLDTIIASNTSYLNIFEVMPERRQSHAVIAHWFAPAHIIPLVEVVRGEHTADATVEVVLDVLRKADKVPVVMEKFVPGFCINRFLRIIGREVFFMIDNGYITPQNLDLAVKASIIPRAMVLGFVQRYDFTGLDLSMMNLQNEGYLEPPYDNAPKSLVERVEKGEYGVKSGKGFFDYSGRKLEAVLKQRDMELLKVFGSVKEMMYKQI